MKDLDKPKPVDAQFAAIERNDSRRWDYEYDESLRDERELGLARSGFRIGRPRKRLDD